MVLVEEFGSEYPTGGKSLINFIT